MAEELFSDRLELRGVGVSSGVGLGKARVMAKAPLQLPQYKIEKSQIDSEMNRFSKAIASVNSEISKMQKRAPKRAPQELKAFLEVFKLLVNDQTLFDEVKKNVQERLINVEWALAIHLEEAKKVFEGVTDSYLAARGDDVEHVVNRLQEELLGGRRVIQEEVRSALGEVILVTSDLSLADVIWLTEYEDLDLVGIITEKGGRTSHTAVLSQTLFIPAIVGVSDARRNMKNGDTVFVDSNTGQIICNPGPQELEQLSLTVQDQEKQYSERYRARRRVAETKDKFRLTLKANVAMVNGLDEVLHLGAQGIGLYRSEYLFMGRDTLPDEEEQFHCYSELLEAMGGRPVTIRTIDVGSDKLLTPEARRKADFGTIHEDNPALGLRAIRFTLANPSFFITHLRAILRASAGYKVRLMLPMVSSIEEIEEAKKYIELAKNQLREENLKFNEDISLGIMIEVPAVAIKAASFLKEVDFASIGTNDLIQYTLGVDRGNSSVAPLYDELHPSVLTLINEVAKAARKLGKPLSVCGEMGGKPHLSPIFIGMGINELSMSAMQIPLVKEQIRELDKNSCEKLVKRLLKQKSSRSVQQMLDNFLERSGLKNVTQTV